MGSAAALISSAACINSVGEGFGIVPRQATITVRIIAGRSCLSPG
jgi:hypothetical protein